MINEIKFKIFTKNKRLRITANHIVYSLLVCSISILYLSKNYFENGLLESIGKDSGIVGFILMIYFVITKNFTREALNGDLKKSIIFRPSELVIDDKIYNLNDISKIEFYIGDYFNKRNYPRSGVDLNPARTNGTNNICELTVQNGQKIKVNFQLMYKDEFLKMKELLVKYYLENKIHFLRLVNYLGIDNYKDIQEFKKTLPPTPVLQKDGNSANFVHLISNKHLW